MPVSGKFNPICTNQNPAVPSFSHLVKPHQLCQHAVKKSGGSALFFLSLLIHMFSPPLVSTFLFICLPCLCLSLSLSLSFCFSCLRCCFSLFLKHTLRFSVFSLTFILSPSLYFCTLFALMPSFSHTYSLPYSVSVICLLLSLPEAGFSLLAHLHFTTISVPLLPQLVAC